MTYGNGSGSDNNDNRAENRQQQQQGEVSYQHEHNDGHDKSKDIGGDLSLLVDIDDAIERLGMGTFQTQILWAAGLCFGADAMEVLLLSFLAVVLKVEWSLTEHEMDSIISVVFAGAMLGTLILSRLGDVYGRRPIFIVAASMIAIFGVATAFCHNFHTLLWARFLVGFGVGGLTVPFDTLAEFVPTSHRGTNLLQIEFFWSAGTLLVPFIAWLTLGEGQSNDQQQQVYDTDDGGSNGSSVFAYFAIHESWQVFVILCAIPCIMSAILGILWVPESPRWLLTQEGKNEEAMRILRLAARRNGLNPNDVFPPGTKLIPPKVAPADSGNFCDLFSPQWLRITLLLWVTWFGLAFLYYGVIIAVSIVFTKTEDKDDYGDGGSYEFDYSAIFISASAEVVGLVIVILTVDKWGRIPSQTATYLSGGICCFLLGFLAASVQDENNTDDDASSSSPTSAIRTTLVILAFLSRMAMMGASCTTWVSTSEILSTDIRATGHGAANAMGRFGGFFCPYIISEGTPLRWIAIFIASVSLVTSYSSWQLPETAGKALGESSPPSSQVDATTKTRRAADLDENTVATTARNEKISETPYHEIL